MQLYAHDAQATTRRTIGRTGPDEEFADQLGSQPAHRRIEEGDMSAIAARSPDDTGSESPAADAAHAIVEACDVLGLSAVVGLLAWPTMPQETKAAPTGSVVLTDDWLGPCGTSAVKGSRAAPPRRLTYIPVWSRRQGFSNESSRLRLVP